MNNEIIIGGGSFCTAIGIIEACSLIKDNKC